MKTIGSAWLVIVMIYTFLNPLQVMAKDSITWLEAVAPPFFIHEGPLRNQGYEDLLTEILITKLPQFDHKRMQASISRHYQQFKQGEKACQNGYIIDFEPETLIQPLGHFRKQRNQSDRVKNSEERQKRIQPDIKIHETSEKQ